MLMHGSEYQQLNLFPEDTDTSKSQAIATPVPADDQRPPVTVTWNLWHGCKKVSAGCQNCYMFRRDQEYGKDPANIHKTTGFNLPVRKYRAGPYKGRYRIPSGSIIYTCFTSDFFIDAADEWRAEAWDMIRSRADCTFFMITKPPERIRQSLPKDWETGWDHVHISCTCENQYWTDRRLPVFLEIPIPHKSITHEPMLEAIDIQKYLEQYGKKRNPDGSRILESVSCGGEIRSESPRMRLWLGGKYACPVCGIRRSLPFPPDRCKATPDNS